MATEIIAVSIELQRESPCQRTLNIDASLGQIWQCMRKGEVVDGENYRIRTCGCRH